MPQKGKRVQNAVTVKMMRPLYLLYRWLVTLFLTTLSIATVEIYKAKGNFPSRHKAAFNTIMLALTLLLGLNLFVSSP